MTSTRNPGVRGALDRDESTAGPVPPQPEDRLLLNATEVARLLGLGRSTIFSLLAAGELPAIRIGRSVRVPRAALERWIEDRTHPR